MDTVMLTILMCSVCDFPLVAVAPSTLGCRTWGSSPLSATVRVGEARVWPLKAFGTLWCTVLAWCREVMGTAGQDRSLVEILILLLALAHLLRRVAVIVPRSGGGEVFADDAKAATTARMAANCVRPKSAMASDLSPLTTNRSELL